MDIILNDYSLDGKFDDLDSFIEWFNIEFKNILDYMMQLILVTKKLKRQVLLHPLAIQKKKG